MTSDELWENWRRRYNLPDGGGQRMTMTVDDFKKALVSAHQRGVDHARQNAQQEDAFVRDFFAGLGAKKAPAV